VGYDYHFEASTSRRPILLFLHGYGEGDGKDELAIQVTRHGPWTKGTYIANQHVQDELSRFFRLGPHLRRKGDLWESGALIQLLDCVRNDHASNIDSEHLFVAGISRGGWGALELASVLGNEITAAAVFCPERVDRLESAVSKMPIYLFHCFWAGSAGL
jgi:predicted peptidase